MHYVYLLQSEKYNYIYVGNTKDLGKRLSEHNEGRVYTTQKYKPFRLIYYEAYLHEKDALNREYKLKHNGSAIGHFKRRLEHSLSK